MEFIHQKYRFIIVVVILLGFFCAAFLSRPAALTESSEALTVSVDRRDFAVLVKATGELDALRSTVISSQVKGDRGKIIYVVEDGKKVDANDVLVRLDPAPFEEEIATLTNKMLESEAIVDAYQQALQWERNQAELAVETARFDLQSKELDLTKLEKGDGPLELARFEGAAQKARLEYEEKSRYVTELEKLQKDGFVSAAEIVLAKNKADEVKRSCEIANLQYASYRDYVLPASIKKAKACLAGARMSYEQTKKGVEFKIGQAAAKLRQAQQDLSSYRASLESAKETLRHTIMRAPIPGMVVLCEGYRGGERRKPRIGDTVHQNQPLVYLPDVSKMIVKTKIREIDLYKVSLDMPVTITVDAYPDTYLSGKVKSIGVLAQSHQEVPSADKFFHILIEVNEGNWRLRPGMTARVEIACADVKDALVVPVQAVFEDSGKTFCYVERGTRFEKRQIEIGRIGIDLAEIKAGLKRGERVAISPPPSG